mmetsp:Transcript_5022/g.10975  ORF Transcript_5022/g.10975 Transcript_5022/m.10975 type:complete len:320 (+) Transcript_5022:150-1109(+)
MWPGCNATAHTGDAPPGSRANTLRIRKSQSSTMPLTPPDASVAPSRESARERAAVSSFSASDEPEAPSDAHPTKPWTRTRPPRLHAGWLSRRSQHLTTCVALPSSSPSATARLPSIATALALCFVRKRVGESDCISQTRTPSPPPVSACDRPTARQSAPRACADACASVGGPSRSQPILMIGEGVSRRDASSEASRWRQRQRASRAPHVSSASLCPGTHATPQHAPRCACQLQGCLRASSMESNSATAPATVAVASRCSESQRATSRTSLLSANVRAHSPDRRHSRAVPSAPPLAINSPLAPTTTLCTRLVWPRSALIV